ncbi:CHAT domain-containing protein [uncultured Phenylobacterium sp.]|uniref:CHAT domain-containing protein n=1 Tax=uncultured Phenylobacterium sp. TaxID=349273 RepID=UPI0025DBCC61|nr:CHAT domain-containing protein [uncultured Phenylobacterium sp.]
MSARLMIAALAAWAVGVTAAAAAAPERFALGQSGASGAICEAVRDYQDPLGQGAAKAWRLRCRGYAASLGRIYQLPIAQKAAWQAALAARAQCGPVEAAPRGLAASLATCRMGEGGAPYVTFMAEGGGTLTVAEGLAPLADVIETGLRVALGQVKPPASTAVQASAAQAEIAADFPNMSGLAAAEAAAAADPDRLRARGYVQNNEWNFDEAETAFRALASEAEVRNAPAGQRAEALLNLAMNISNNGRFAEAEGFFAEAEGLIPAGEPLLRARGLNYRALHERNRGRFAPAIAAAQQAMALRASTPEGAANRPAERRPPTAGGGLVIDPGLARRLNQPSAAQSQIANSKITIGEQLAIQDAQAWQVIGTAEAARGNAAASRAALERAREALLRSATVGRRTAWLQARVEADLASLDLKAGQAAQAAARYDSAITTLRTRHAGSATEGALLLDLGRAQAAAGREADALASYGRAMAIFTEQRGGLGASVDQAQPYFDLLLKAIDGDPGKAVDYAGRFFDASQTVVSSATAETVNRLAARVAASDSAIAGLSRAFEDSRRRLRATESQIAALQADGAYTEAVRVEMEAALKTEQAEADTLEARMLAANPRYNQLVAPGAPVGEVQKALRAGEVYLKLLPLGGRTYGVLVTPTTVKPYAVGMSRAQVLAAVTRVRTALEPSERLLPFDAAASAALFDQLMGPVKAEVLAARHLIYEPDGALLSLPVSLFVTDAASIRQGADGDTDYAKVAWLGTRSSASLVVSGASFLQSRAFAPSRAQQPYLGFADPNLPRTDPKAFTSVTRSFLRRSAVLEEVCGATRTALLRIEALPETLAEVRAVGASLGTPGSVVTGAAFSDDAVRDRTDLADYRVLYFATHGLLPQPDACVPEPALVTSLGEGDSDALLDSSEILNLKIDADLVVLAACDTGGAGATVDRTGLTGGGEALGGLTRAMIYAGSRALIVSHWSIESESAVRLMTGLFASSAPTFADALQRSQAALQADPQYAHPYFWAPFTLVGDGARPLPAQPRQIAGS